jgi:hypothetical protein
MIEQKNNSISNVINLLRIGMPLPEGGTWSWAKWKKYAYISTLWVWRAIVATCLVYITIKLIQHGI